MSRLLICVALFSLATTAMADITVTDGGYTISVSDNHSSRYVKRESFSITGTGNDAPQAFNLANQRTNERTKEFGCALDKVVGVALPAIIVRPVVAAPVVASPCPAPCPAPCPPVVPAPAPVPVVTPACPPPLGGVPGVLNGIIWSRCGAFFHAYVAGRGWRRFDVPIGARHLYAARPLNLSGWFFNTGRLGCLLAFRDACTCADLIDP